MKKYLLLFLSIVLLNMDTNAQTTYTWNGGTTSWSTASNWTPARTSPTSTDILVFNASNTIVLDFTTPETIGQLQVTGGSAVIFQTGATRVLNIGAGEPGDDFTIGSGSSLTVQSTTSSVNLTLQMLTGNTAKINGAINFGAGASATQAHKFQTPDAEGIIFENGSSFTTISVSSGNPFGSANVPTNNNVVFKNGSNYFSGGGSNPFSSTAPAAVVKFEDESNYIINSTTGLSSTNRRFGNIVVNVNVNALLTGAIVLNNLTVNSGFTLTLPNSNNRWNIAGSVNVAGSIVNATGTSYPDFSMIGTGALQTINFNTDAIKMRSFSVGTDANVLLANNFLVNTASPQQNIYGILNMADKVIDGNSVGSVAVRTANSVNAPLTSALLANRNTFSSVPAPAGISNGMLVTSPAFPDNTYIINTSSGVFTTSKLSIAPLNVGDVVVISQGSGTLKTSNTGGLNASLPGFAAYDMKGNYEFNAATVTPFPSGASTVNAQAITTNAGITLNKPVNLIDVLNVNSGTLTTGGLLTINSDANGTARIAPVLGSISGDVTVERYIPANGRRAWRLLGANVSSVGAPTINTAWQEGGAATSNGTHITQAGGASTNGFDGSTTAVNSSIRYYDGAALQTPANTDVTKITDHSGAFFLFVRGNRTIDLNNASESGNTTLRQTGSVNQGNIATGTTGAFSLVPNPYPSPVDYEAIFTHPSNSALVTGQYYIWDANMASVGGYRTIQRNGVGDYTSTPTTGSDNTMRYIRSGQAFFIPVNTQVNFTETMKTNMVPTTNVFRTGAGTEEMTIDLRVMNGNPNGDLYDGVRAQYNNSYSASVDANDAPKLNNFNENLAITRDNVNLAVEQRPLADAGDTLFLKLWNTGIKNYRFDINPSNFSTTANLEAFLVDSYLNTTTPVSLSANTMYDFSVTSNTASAAADRFMIVYKSSAPLPVNFTNLKATQKNAGIQVEWNVAAEVDVVKYDVEKSANGTAFDKAGTVSASNSKTYNWFDVSPNSGNNYYRIKVINKDNSTSYSNVVNVKIGNNKGDIAVYPNPVKAGVINLQFTNQEKGTYKVQLFNNLGQQVFTGKIVHQGGSASETLLLNNNVSKGVYQLVVTNSENSITSQLVVE